MRFNSVAQLGGQENILLSLGVCHVDQHPPLGVGEVEGVVDVGARGTLVLV